ncbi:aminoacyl-tRNA hydrolase [Candidatus Anaplasma sp. TIGMIC]|uniref:aminoacyl-tRNA hydrolase n=1 Tax=Candidatus Anaplasma sp. TIGMIC TaxID=3020713 RepID=UPI0023303E5D|nr:aminoacyl-tRNA hydrolase [Candidatus Anaplasma sp. TIGMIC]MDB1135287.1 aminoacyl-tRNA hydrolase [Candidatus Anaplasma sp. TIGMIC]
MLLFVGLGNPGKRYEMTRHNVGFMILDAVARRFGFPEFCCKHNADVSIGDLESHRVVLLKPLSYMNNSGDPVQRAVSLYKMSLDSITVFHDDTELRQGVIRVKRGGGSGGHNGIRSIDAAIGKDYLRVRFGVGRSDGCNMSDYVLSDFTNPAAVHEAIANIAENIPMLLNGDAAEFISKVSVPF